MMIDSQPVLVISDENNREVPLKLSLEPWPLTLEDFTSKASSLQAHSRVCFCLKNFPESSTGEFTANLFLGEELITTTLHFNAGQWFLRPVDILRPFDETIGLAQLRLEVSDGFESRLTLYASPLTIELPNNAIARNLIQMSASVAELSSSLFGQDVHLIQNSLTMPDNIRLLNEIAYLYENQYPFFKENPHTSLKTTPVRRSIEALREVTAQSARSIATHPDELQRVKSRSALKIHGQYWMPRHALVKSVAPSRETQENHAVLGFLNFLATQCAVLGGKLRQETSLEENTVIDALALASASSQHERLKWADHLKILEKRFRHLFVLYRKTLEIEPKVFSQMPRPTRIFLESSPYRMIYQAMKAWFSLPEFNLDVVIRRLASTTCSRLYEYFSLVIVLRDAMALGFTLSDKDFFSYSNKSLYYQNNAKAALFNTFTLKRDDETLRLWYQPIIGSNSHFGHTENGIELFRQTNWSLSPNMDSMKLHRVDEPWYSPDFVLSLEKKGKRAWALLDSKYSKISTVSKRDGLALAFKYLLSVATTSDNDHYAGLFLLCGSIAEKDNDEGAFFNMTAMGGQSQKPTMIFSKLNAQTASERNSLEGVYGQLAALL